MTATARGQKYRAVIGKESAEGTPNTTDNTLWEFSVADGSTMASEHTEEDLTYSSADDMVLGPVIRTAMGGGELISPCDPWTCAVLSKLHLGGSAISGSDPYTHTLTKAAAPLFTTVFFMRPDVVGGTDKWERFDDSFLKTLAFHGEAGHEVTIKSTFASKKGVFTVTAPAPTATPASGAAGDYTIPTVGKGKLNTMNGATMKLDLDATPGATTIHNIRSFDLVSSFEGFEWIQTDALNPSYYSKGLYTCGLTATVLFDSFSSYYSTFYGTKTVGADGAQSAVPVTGAANFLFPATDGTASRTVQLLANAQRFEATPAAVQTSGDAVEVTLTGRAFQPASGVEPFSVVALNNRSTTP